MDDDGYAIGMILMATALSLGLVANGYQSWKGGTLFADAWSVVKAIAAFVLIPVALLIVVGALSGLPGYIQIFIRDGFIWLLIVGLMYGIWFTCKNWSEIRSGMNAGDDDPNLM